MEENQTNSSRHRSAGYYETNAEAFIQSTLGADMTSLYERFEAHLHAGCRILDLGSGSGRDSLYFSEKGCQVTAVDVSPAMCRQTEELAGVPVYCMGAEELSFKEEFDAVWACASLLHVSREDMQEVLQRLERALCPGGILYASWKYGERDREVEGRFFTDYTESSMTALLDSVEGFQIEDMWVTTDVRRDRSEQKWLNVLLRK